MDQAQRCRRACLRAKGWSILSWDSELGMLISLPPQTTCFALTRHRTARGKKVKRKIYFTYSRVLEFAEIVEKGRSIGWAYPLLYLVGHRDLLLELCLGLASSAADDHGVCLLSSTVSGSKTSEQENGPTTSRWAEHLLEGT